MVAGLGVPIFRVFTVDSPELPYFFCYKTEFFTSKTIQKICIHLISQGPVVQSIVSLTSSLRGQLVKCFTTL